MPELIDRQALIKDMCNNKTEAKCPCYPNCYPCDFSEARRIIEIQPTIEPEVRHGRWQEIGGYEPENQGFACSVCDFATTVKSRFCPNCGARMDGGAGND